MVIFQADFPESSLCGAQTFLKKYNTVDQLFFQKVRQPRSVFYKKFDPGSRTF